MVRELSIASYCEVSATDFWSLRSDRGYDEWFAELDGQVSRLVNNEQTKTDEGLDYVQRLVKLEFKQNPMPHFLRKQFGLHEFAFHVTSSFYKDAFDEEHPYTYSTEFPILTDRISVEGVQWLQEISDTRCRLQARVRIHVQLKCDTLNKQLHDRRQRQGRADLQELIACEESGMDVFGRSYRHSRAGCERQPRAAIVVQYIISSLCTVDPLRDL